MVLYITCNCKCVVLGKEFEYDISGLFFELNNKGIPLSYILFAGK